MAKMATICSLGAGISTTPITNYDSTKLNLGSLMRQNSGITSETQWAGPLYPPLIARIGDLASASSFFNIYERFYFFEFVHCFVFL